MESCLVANLFAGETHSLGLIFSGELCCDSAEISGATRMAALLRPGSDVAPTWPRLHTLV